MTKQTFEEKVKRNRARQAKRIDSTPVIGMAHYAMGDIATVKLQIIKLTKKSVTMRSIHGGGTITLTSNNGSPIEDIIKIERLPCSIIPTLTKDGTTIKIPQGSDVPL